MGKVPVDLRRNIAANIRNCRIEPLRDGDEAVERVEALPLESPHSPHCDYVVGQDWRRLRVTVEWIT